MRARMSDFSLRMAERRGDPSDLWRALFRARRPMALRPRALGADQIGDAFTAGRLACHKVTVADGGAEDVTRVAAYAGDATARELLPVSWVRDQLRFCADKLTLVPSVGDGWVTGLMPLLARLPGVVASDDQCDCKVKRLPSGRLAAAKGCLECDGRGRRVHETSLPSYALVLCAWAAARAACETWCRETCGGQYLHECQDIRRALRFAEDWLICPCPGRDRVAQAARATEAGPCFGYLFDGFASQPGWPLLVIRDAVDMAGDGPVRSSLQEVVLGLVGL